MPVTRVTRVVGVNVRVAVHKYDSFLICESYTLREQAARNYSIVLCQLRSGTTRNFNKLLNRPGGNHCVTLAGKQLSLWRYSQVVTATD